MHKYLVFIHNQWFSLQELLLYENGFVLLFIPNQWFCLQEVLFYENGFVFV